MAMTICGGWKDLLLKKSVGTNPDSEHSIVVYARTDRKKQYGYEPYILLSQVLTKESHEDFTQDELFPVQRVEYTDPEGCGGYGPVVLTLWDGSVKRIEFEGIEGQLML